MSADVSIAMYAFCSNEPMRWNPDTLRCQVAIRPEKVALVASIGVVGAIGIAVAAVFLRRMSRRAKVLAAELESLKVEYGQLHEPLLDVDTPISKITDFLKELSEYQTPKGLFQRLTMSLKYPYIHIQSKASELRQLLRQSQGVYMPTFGLVNADQNMLVEGDLADNANYLLQMVGMSSTHRKPQKASASSSIGDVSETGIGSHNGNAAMTPAVRQ
eukprot:scaffold240869_cov16-Prasinocladus_malaysianus.AAC.1